LRLKKRVILIDPATKDYLLVMQYADGGDLQSYLKNHFNHLTWNDKKNWHFKLPMD